MGTSYLCATETSADPNLATDCFLLPHPSGGWFDVTLTGMFFWLWRDGLGEGGNAYLIHEWAVYDAPNQTKHAIARSNYAAIDADHEKDNLTANHENRCMISSTNPL